MKSGWNAEKVKRHAQWAREGGLKSLIEEDELDPRQRMSNELAMWKYRRENPTQGPARALWVLGAQRSGTNMVMRGLGKHGGTKMYNENHRKAFRDFELLADDSVRSLIENCSQPVIVFKPLCDSDRAGELLDLGGPTSRAAWIYRNVDARARSAVTKFGSANLDMMKSLEANLDNGEWWSRSVTPEQRAQVVELTTKSLSPHDAAALFWWMRNSIFFSDHLYARHDVALVKYQTLLESPSKIMSDLCQHVGLKFEPVMVDHFEPFRSPASRLELHPGVRSLCDELTSRLDSRSAS